MGNMDFYIAWPTMMIKTNRATSYFWGASILNCDPERDQPSTALVGVWSLTKFRQRAVPENPGNLDNYYMYMLYIMWYIYNTKNIYTNVYSYLYIYIQYVIYVHLAELWSRWLADSQPAGSLGSTLGTRSTSAAWCFQSSTVVTGTSSVTQNCMAYTCLYWKILLKWYLL